jgi:hypothetical protein
MRRECDPSFRKSGFELALIDRSEVHADTDCVEQCRNDGGNQPPAPTPDEPFVPDRCPVRTFRFIKKTTASRADSRNSNRIPTFSRTKMPLQSFRNSQRTANATTSAQATNGICARRVRKLVCASAPITSKSVQINSFTDVGCHPRLRGSSSVFVAYISQGGHQ